MNARESAKKPKLISIHASDNVRDSSNSRARFALHKLPQATAVSGLSSPNVGFLRDNNSYSNLGTDIDESITFSKSFIEE